MYPSTNIRSGLPTSTETTTLDIPSSTSYYVTQTEFSTKTKALMDEFKKYINLSLQPLHTKMQNLTTPLNPLKTKMKMLKISKNSYSPWNSRPMRIQKNWINNIFKSSITSSYDKHLDKISINNINKIETSRKENEELLKKNIWLIQSLIIYPHRYESLCSQFIQKSFFLWPTFSLSHQMATSQVNRF